MYNELRSHSYISYLLGCLFGFTLLLSSCKTEYPELPYNEIEKFRVVDETSGVDISAAIQGNEIIFLYWPPLVGEPDSIRPEITVSEGATVFPASLENVPFGEEVTYTVTAENGEKRQYRLLPTTGQPPIDFTFSDNAFNLGKSDMAIRVQHVIPDPEKTKVFLINEDNNQTEMEMDWEFAASFPNTLLFKPFHQLDTGNYYLKIVSGVKELTKGPYNLKPPVTLYETEVAGNATTVKRGGTLELTVPEWVGKYLNKRMKLVVPNYDYSLIWEVTDATDTGFKIKIPESAPLITLSVFEFYDENQGYVAGSVIPGVTITE